MKNSTEDSQEVLMRYTGMPGWKGVIDDREMWAIVRYLRHLPPKESLGIPAVFKEDRHG